MKPKIVRVKDGFDFAKACREAEQRRRSNRIHGLVRIFFCGAPAFMLTAWWILIDWRIGLILWIGVFWLGWKVTEPRADRGETKF